MSLDDMFAKADAATRHAMEEAEDRARNAEQATRAQQEFTEQFLAWTADAVRRLREAEVPQQRAKLADNAIDESPAVGKRVAAPPRSLLRSVMGLLTGSGSDESAGERRTASPTTPRQEVSGWVIYACTEPTPDYPYGLPHRPLAIPGESVFMRDSVVESYEHHQALLLTSDGDARVAKGTNRKGIELSYGSVSPTEYTLEPSAGDEEEPWLQLVGRDAAGLTIDELYLLSGLGRFSYPWDPYSQSREEYKHSEELDRHWNEETRQDQLAYWELGVRYKLSRHAAGLPAT